MDHEHSGGAAEPGDAARGGRRGPALWIAAALAALVVLGLVVRAGQALVERLGPPEDVEAAPSVVEVIEVAPRPFERTVPIAGTLAPVHSVDVFPKVGGKVVRVFVALGDEVHRGEALVTVESTEYGMQAEQARIGYEMAEEAVAMAERSFQRLQSVRERSGSLGVSDQAFEEARIQLEGAVTQRDQARLQADLARQMVRNATLVAPVDGRVSKVNARLGAMVGTEYPALHIDDTSELVVHTEVGDLDLPLVAPGQAVRLWTDALPGRVITGTVAAVSPTLDAWTRRAPVEIAVPNPDGDITGNLFARGEIVVGRDPAATVLPLEVVHRGVDGASVQVVDGGVVRRIDVSVVAESRETVQVDGLRPGQLVIVPGAEHLAQGEPVVVAGGGGDGTHVDQ